MKEKWEINDTGVALLLFGSVTFVLITMNFGKNLVVETIKHVKRQKELKVLKQIAIRMDEIVTDHEEQSKKK